MAKSVLFAFLLAVYTSVSTADSLVSTLKEDLRKCQEECLANFDKPGPELRQCLLECRDRYNFRNIFKTL